MAGMGSRNRRAGWLAGVLVGVALMGVLQIRRSPSGPLTYRTGRVDARFGVDPADFEAAMREAAGQWNRAAGRELLRMDPRGEVDVSLVYDERQSAADRVKALERGLEHSSQGIREGEARLQGLKADLDFRRRGLEADVAAHAARLADWKERLEAARRAQTLTEAAVRVLNRDQEALKAQAEALQLREAEVRELREAYNREVDALNARAARHNQGAEGLQAAGASLGAEFCGGEFVQEGRRKAIAVYFVASRPGLVRVLTHEFGHALGLSHLEAPNAVMHPRTAKDDPELTPEDVQAIRARGAGRR